MQVRVHRCRCTGAQVQVQMQVQAQEYIFRCTVLHRTPRAARADVESAHGICRMA